MEAETLQSVWNFDGAELSLIFEIKVDVGESLKDWKLEDAYWSLRDLRREIDAKLNREKKNEIKIIDKEGKEQTIKITEKEQTDIFLEKVETKRNIYLKNTESDEEKSKFYLGLESFYLHLAFLMKKHGLYFREGDDPSRAIWRK